MADEAEILVHIAAPSTSTDDFLYRTLAQAYLDFEPHTRTELPLPPDPRDAPLLSDDLFSPQLSFNSVWENIRSPALARVKTANATHQNSTESASQADAFSQGSWVPPPSELPDSMPDNDITMDGFNTPTRILNYFLQTTESFSESSQESDDGRRDTTIYEGNEDFTSILAQKTPLRKSHINHPASRPHHSPLREPIDKSIVLETPVNHCQLDSPLRWVFENTTVIGTAANPPPHDGHLADALGETTVVEAPATPSPLQMKQAPPVRSSGRRRSWSTDASPRSSSSQTGSHDRVIPSTQLPTRADSEPPWSKRPRLNRPDSAIQRLGRSASDLLPQGPSSVFATSANASREQAHSAEPLDIDWSGDTQIVSVEPKVSNHKLGPRPPAYLEWYVKTAGMVKKYKPSFQAREMRPYERGYWLLDLNGWDHDARLEAWKFLGNFIRRDSGAGWGTRACRDEHWGWIRLYGWEHIAGELYMLLYVASYRRIKYMELTWFDGAGKELIIVGARAEKPQENRA